jgi:cell division protein FtsQ
VQTLPRIEATYRAPLVSADLRHAGGYAIRLKGVTTQVPAAPGRKR